MSRIEALFKNKQVFVGYITGGDGSVAYSIDCCLALLEGGVDILELGLPFSDPIADGPTIQLASARALREGTTSETLLTIAAGIRKHSKAPLILFSYYNPLLQAGVNYFHRMKGAGFDGVLAVDLPIGLPGREDRFFIEATQQAKLDPILVATPSTPSDRIRQLASKTRGFLYYACQKGTTGTRAALPPDFAEHLTRIKKQSEVPIAAGFGIADRSSAEQALRHADAFVVGSAFVKLMEQRVDPLNLKALAQQIDPRQSLGAP